MTGRYSWSLVLALLITSSATAQPADKRSASVVYSTPECKLNCVQLGQPGLLAMPDTVRPERYFPIEDGTNWLYVQEGLYTDDKILGTTTRGDVEYHVLRSEGYGEDQNQSFSFDFPIRYDPATRAVRTPGSDGEEGYYLNVCPFDIDFNVVVSTGSGECFATGEYEDTVYFVDIDGARVDSVTASTKTFFFATGLSITYAADIGIVGSGIDGQGKRIAYFHGARDYGKTFVSNDQGLVEAFKVELYPNPSFNGFRVRAARERRLMVSVYDVRGRRVTGDLEASRLPSSTVRLIPGVYAVHIEDIDTSSLVIRTIVIL